MRTSKVHQESIYSIAICAVLTSSTTYTSLQDVVEYPAHHSSRLARIVIRLYKLDIDIFHTLWLSPISSWQIYIV